MSIRLESPWQRVVLVMACAGALATEARAEDVSERQQVASSRTRLRGAVGVRAIPGGFLSVGGGKLRYLADHAKAWTTIHQVAGDSLYRLDSDDDGRVLAVWEKEPLIHLFDLGRGTHRTVAKPPSPPGYKPQTTFHVSELRFSRDGGAAIVFVAGSVWAYDTGSRMVQAAFRVDLAGHQPPVLLYSDEAFPLHASAYGAAMVKPKSWSLGCTYQGCPVDRIIVYELGSGRAVKKTIFEDKVQRVDSARIVRGGGDHRFAVQIGSWDGKRHRRLLRYWYGRAPLVHELAEWNDSEIDLNLFAGNDDFVEARQGEDKAVTFTRVDLAGQASTAVVRPWTDARGRPAKAWMTSFGERASGGLWLHWDDNIVVGDLAAPRKLDVGDLVKRGTEWAGAYLYSAKPESLWLGIEVGGGRDYVRIGFDEIERRARPWTPPTAKLGTPDPMPPTTTRTPAGTRREVALAGGMVSIGDRDLYYRASTAEPWRLLHAVPGHSIYRLQVDEARGRILGHWSAEQVFHLFEPGRGVHRTLPWPTSDLPGGSSGLANLFFAGDRFALVYMTGRAGGGGGNVNEGYRVPLDGKGAGKRLFRSYGNPLDLSERGATFVLPTRQSGYRCDTATCIVDSISVVDIAGDVATERVVLRRDQQYIDFANRVPGKAGDELAVVIRYSTTTYPERALLRFRYGAPGVDRVVLPAWTTEAVKRNHLTLAGDYLEFVVDGKGHLVVERLDKRGARSSQRIPPLPHRDRDARVDQAVHGFGVRSGGGSWLHWGDSIVLLRDGEAPRAFDLSSRLKARGEWGGADRYTTSPESLRIAVDIGAGREYLDVSFAAIEQGAKRVR